MTPLFDLFPSLSPIRTISKSRLHTSSALGYSPKKHRHTYPPYLQQASQIYQS